MFNILYLHEEIKILPVYNCSFRAQDISCREEEVCASS